jgi:hypothetical protein
MQEDQARADSEKGSLHLFGWAAFGSAPQARLAETLSVLLTKLPPSLLGQLHLPTPAAAYGRPAGELLLTRLACVLFAGKQDTK